MITAKSFKMLGFIKRTTSYFTSLDTIVYLFKSLVLPNLNYGSIIWSPYTKDKYDDLNSVLKKFLRYASYKIGNPMDFNNHDYNNISIKCKIYKAESVHKYNDILFVLNNIKGNISSSNFKENFKESDLTYDLREFRQFQEVMQKRDYI